jgi:uncharacterized membrane protein
MFEFLFKYPPEAYAKGKLVLLGSWPLWLLLLFVLLAGAGFGWLAWKRKNTAFHGARGIAIWLLQTALVALILFLLWQPALSLAALKPQQNIVAVVVDDSRSMAIADSGAPRIEQAKKLLRDGLLDKLNKQYQVRLYRLDSGLTRVDDLEGLTASGPATRIGGGLKQLAAEAGTLPLGAVVLLTDGADNTGGIDVQTLSALRARRLPVSTVGFGQEQLTKDIEVERFEVPGKALAHSRIEAQISIRQRGFDSAKCTLTVLAGGSVANSRQITLNSSGQQFESIEFDSGPAGVKNLEVKLDPLAGEENTENNRLTRAMLVDDTKRRILYVEGEPRWDYKFLRRAVEDDQVLQVASMLRTTQNKIYRQGVASPDDLAQGFPNRAEELFSYQGLILGSVETGFFTSTQQALIKEFVDRRGGGVLFLAGPASFSEGGYGAAPFAELLPVTLPPRKNTFQRDMVEAELTEVGKQSLVCRMDEDAGKSQAHWKILPLLANYQEIGIAKPGASVLAQMNVANKKLPLLVIENYGRGRSAAFATGGSWRWKMQQPKEDTSHQIFWRQMLRWVVGATPSHVTVSTSNTALTDDGQVQLRAEVRGLTYLAVADAQVEARIVLPDGSANTVPLRPDPVAEGMYAADWNASQAGSYVVEVTAQQGKDDLGRDTAAFRRENGTAESFHHEQNRELLQRLSEETGGLYYRPKDAGKLAESISFSEAGITARETRDIWDMPFFFLLALALRSGEWLLRRRWGVI